MRRFEHTSLWQKTLAVQLEPDVEAASRGRLRAAFEAFRDRAAILAAEIAIDLPDFTVHDITHLDALWETAQLVTGSDYLLTPAEAFVLGGAFLIHDLGMGLAAFPSGVLELKTTDLWRDCIAASLKKSLGRLPSLLELTNPPKEVEQAAMREVLRELHAKHAEKLALISWGDENLNGPYFLIDDADIRNTYGPIIGTIAHSHWWSVEELQEKLSVPMGAPGGFSNDWTIDPIKLACILRTADACHLDDRRAPGFLNALRKPKGVSASHWKFQEKLYQPRLEGDRLAYTSKSNFSIDESSAWWICFETLTMVDKELRHVDALLSDLGKPRLAVRGISYIEDAKRLSKLIKTENWFPVDAKIKIGNVAQLILTLGGEKLYGKNDNVPLRELIQNASDAVRARRILEGLDSDWGKIIVRKGRDAAGHWIEVEDNGIGMSLNVLTGPFLDFGSSFWGSSLMHRELPGLEAKGFNSAGQFGVGFFSVFMWGRKIQVITRRAELARDDTLVLEFSNGLNSRPIVKKASKEEMLMDGGTRVRVWLDNPRTVDEMLNFGPYDLKLNFDELLAWLCPTLDVSIYFGDAKRPVVAASDWKTISVDKFIKRFNVRSSKKNKISYDVSKFINNNLRFIKDRDGNIIGRACVLHFDRYGSDKNESVLDGIVSAGGFRSSDLTGVFGVFLGKPHTAARNISIPIVDGDVLSEWATEQAELISCMNLADIKQIEYASIIRALGGDTCRLKVCEGYAGFLSAADITDQVYDDEVIIVFDSALSNASRDGGKITLNRNVISVDAGRPGILQTRRWDIFIDWPKDNINCTKYNSVWVFHSRTLQGVVLESLESTWGTSLDNILLNSKVSSDKKSISRVVGVQNGVPVELDGVDIISRYKK